MISIRNATDSDAGKLWDIRSRAIGIICSRSYDAETIEKWLAISMPDDWGHTLEEKGAIVAMHRGEIAGFGIADLEAQTIEAVFVSPHLAGRGIGRRLLDELEQLAIHAGITTLKLLSSLNAVNFYQKSGYVAGRKEVFHHPGGFGIDCYFMRKQLGARVT